MAQITGMRDGVDKPMTAQDEQRHLLEQRLTEARERIMHAENDLAMWRPLEASCLAGLRALDEAVGATQAKSIVAASESEIEY